MVLHVTKPNPRYLGGLIRESMDDAGWNVIGTVALFGCERGTLSRLLNCKAGVSGEHGAGAGGCRLGHCRALDASADELRACAGAQGPVGSKTASRRGAPMVVHRARAAGLGTVPLAVVRPPRVGSTPSNAWRKVGDAA